jgi:hypothetical protein
VIHQKTFDRIDNSYFKQVRSTILDEQTDSFDGIMQYLKDRDGGKPKKVLPKAQRESIKRMLEISEEGTYKMQ